MKGIIFTENIDAIMEGRKTQTRRVIKPQPPTDYHLYPEVEQGSYLWTQHDYNDDMMGWFPSYYKGLKPCFKAGETVYLKETWCKLYNLDGNDQCIEGTGRYYYAADNPKLPYNRFLRDDGTFKDYPAWKSPMYMPQSAARTFLRITGVRVERLQDITILGAMDEGCRGLDSSESAIGYDPKEEYQRLWDILNFDKGWAWERNPWVWVYTFERAVGLLPADLSGLQDAAQPVLMPAT